MPRKKKLLWSGPAFEDLREIREHVSLDNPSAARLLAKRIRQCVTRLREHSGSGRIVPEFEPLGYREVIVSPYRIVYAVQKGAVVVLRVWHGRRDLTDQST
ncbi:MAG: type II toxin-antitoxin system RelE/ParE family toxin [Deltaproteobacteria bacterium]|nr:type II toxin-antitoxin system RelE/ParE family toxin [Deltaproteobacteria bacterium]